MGMVGEASTSVNMEVVEHEKRGEVTEGRRSNGSPDDSASTLLGFYGEDALHDGSGDTGHVLWWRSTDEQMSRED